MVSLHSPSTVHQDDRKVSIIILIPNGPSPSYKSIQQANSCFSFY